MRRALICAVVTVTTFLATAAVSTPPAIELVSPKDGAEVSLLPEVQRRVMALPTLDERLAFFATNVTAGGKSALPHDWRIAASVTLAWTRTAGEEGPWEIRLGTHADLGDARVFFCPQQAAAATNDVVRYKLPRPNLELGRTYYWRVTSGVWCGNYDHSRGKCGCTNVVERVSAVAAFTTAAEAPRWIAVEGRVKNMRDLGGRRTTDGRRVRQGMVFRGQAFNDNSFNGDQPGRNRLMVEDVLYLKGTLGIRTDLDLRNPREVSTMTASPLGPDVRLVVRSSGSYREIFTDEFKAVMAANFRVFCDPANYPIYFHCIAGADRTGSLAYVLNGVLGVDRHGLETDWESTFYPNIPDARPDPNYWCRESHFNDGFARYGAPNDTWSRRIELYLLDCGVTPEEIAAFRAILLEDK